MSDFFFISSEYCDTISSVATAILQCPLNTPVPLCCLSDILVSSWIRLFWVVTLHLKGGMSPPPPEPLRKDHKKHYILTLNNLPTHVPIMYYCSLTVYEEKEEGANRVVI